MIRSKLIIWSWEILSKNKQYCSIYVQAELEELRRKASDMDANLQSKYHKALKQMEILVKDNTLLKNDNNGLKN